MAEVKEEQQSAANFADTANEGQVGVVKEFWYFLRYNKKWWITPIVIVLLMVAALVVLGGNPAAAPFIYTLF